jgi:uncharacterized delta-60 repeat protein
MKGKFIAPSSGVGAPDFSEEVYLGGSFLVTSPMDYYPATGILTLNDDATLNGRFKGSQQLFLTPSLSVVTTSAMQSDGKILYGGSYLFNRVGRFNADGTIDTTFANPVTVGDTVRKITIQPDGKILVGGNFTTYNSQGYNRIVRLNSSGTIDTSFIIGTGFSSEVYDIAIQSDGKILVAGAFTTYNGSASNAIIRLEPNGTRDTTFVIGTGFNGTVRRLKIQPDGKILAGGVFTSYNGTTSNRIIRLESNGAIDTTFSIGTGFTTTVFDIELDSSENVFVCGDFTSYNGTTSSRLVKLSHTGAIDASLVIGNGFNGRTRRVYVNSDGSMYVLGSFTTYKGINFRGAVKISSIGDLDYSFNTRHGLTYSGITDDFGVHDIQITSDNKVVLFGGIYGYKGETNTYVVGMNKSANVNQEMRAQLARQGFSNGEVRRVLIQPDGMVLIGGTYSLKLARYDVNWNRDGNFSVTFNSGTLTSPNSLAVDSLGRILMVGSFTTVNSVSRNRIARILKNGSLDTSFVVGTGFPSDSVIVIKLQPDGKILVGGNSGTTYNGETFRGLIRLNDDGTVDNTFLLTTGGITVRAIHVQSDGKILIGGDFSSYNGTSISPSNSLIRLNADGTRDLTFVAPDMRTTWDIIETSDGKILACGGLTGGVRKLNQDGSLDTSFSCNMNFSGSEQARSIVEFSNGKIAVGGLFGSIENILCRNFVILNSDGSYSGIDSGVGNYVNSIALKN